MGLMSTLALLVLPLLRRPELADKSLPATIDPRIIEIAALKAEVDDLKRRLEDAERDLDWWRVLANAWRARAETSIDQRVQAEAAIIRAQAQAQVQMLQMAQYNPVQQHLHAAQNAQNFYAEGADQFHQAQAQNRWHDCTCVPGRAGILRRQGED